MKRFALIACTLLGLALCMTGCRKDRDLDKDRIVKEGEGFQVVAAISGEVPDEAVIILRTGKGEPGKSTPLRGPRWPPSSTWQSRFLPWARRAWRRMRPSRASWTRRPPSG